MSSSMETAMLLSGRQEKFLSWKDVDKQRWQSIRDKCPARDMADDRCMITFLDCDYDGCFGRVWSGAI